jgi:hypothetical protein
MAQEVGSLPNKHEALSSNSSTTKKTQTQLHACSLAQQYLLMGYF